MIVDFGLIEHDCFLKTTHKEGNRTEYYLIIKFKMGTLELSFDSYGMLRADFYYVPEYHRLFNSGYKCDYNKLGNNVTIREQLDYFDYGHPEHVLGDIKPELYTMFNYKEFKEMADNSPSPIGINLDLLDKAVEHYSKIERIV